STNTTIASLPAVDGVSGPIKSNVHVCPGVGGDGIGMSGPAVFWVLPLLRWHLSHVATYLSIIVPIVGHQNLFSICAIVLSLPKCPAVGASWHSCIIFVRTHSFLGTTN